VKAWFRIHLSTAVMLSLAAGVLLWANMHVSSMQIHGIFPIDDTPWNETAGWPFKAYTQNLVFRMNEFDKFVPYPTKWHYDYAAYNLLIACAILLVVTFASESITRRRHLNEWPFRTDKK
jgi:hypothetical protein